MSPPKKQTTVASNFFTRGKKPTTNARVITAKNAIVPASTPPPKPVSKKQAEDDIDEVQDFDSGEDEDNASEATEEHDDEHQEEEEEDLSVVRDDEIQSDDSTDFGFEHKVERATAMPTGMQHKLPGRVTTTPAKGARVNNKKKVAVPTFVDVGDIHVGFHQADLSEQEKLLRQFDLSYKYGPCTDMTRMERWERAFTLGLNPPQHIKDTLLEHSSLNTPLFEGRV
ncbi:hypothetical protein BG006_005785 [Podila minutissima]|uniref:DNA polymerase delta subunit 4 n=1 Tax=Podila minutissima TaxID=64525 RepID=A0A9P5SJF6_9FUNG|nr:hypothetical protein BG006_005785 [Podila minutissima]